MDNQVQNQKLVLQPGNHPHVMVATAIEKDTERVATEVTTIGATDNLMGIDYRLPEGGTIVQEIPARGSAQVREPHADIKVGAGRFYSCTQVEINPFDMKLRANFD